MFKKKQKQVKWNINEYILVKLTDRGKYIHRKSHEDLMKTLGDNRGSAFQYYPPVENKEGFAKFQGWEFMQKFGPYMGCGTDLVCETEVFIESSS